MTTTEGSSTREAVQSGRKSSIRGLEFALAAAIVLTLGVFIYLWSAHDLPGAAWLLPFVWVPLMVWDYMALRRGEVMSLALVIFGSIGTFLFTTIVLFSQAGQTAGLVAGLAGFAIFAAMLAAGAYMLGRVADDEGD